jgi:type III restriction enzyme
VIAHDRFDEVIKKAREADSIVQIKEYTIGEGGDITTAPQTVLTVPTAFEAALTGAAPQVPEGEGKVREAPAPVIFDTPEDRKVAQLTIDLIREKYERELKGGHKELKSPEVQKRIAEDVRRISKARQGTLRALSPSPMSSNWWRS